MRSSFDLLDAPWIPCIPIDRGSPVRLGLRDALGFAHTYTMVQGVTPLATGALLRLLVGVLHAALEGPRGADAWHDMYEAGRFDVERLDAYLLPLRDRFDLFHPERPFMQVATLVEACAGPVAKLAHDRASGNNATLFDHSRDDGAASLDAADAAQLLLVHHQLALGGMLSYEPGADPLVHKFAKAGPLVNCVSFYPQGTTLFETLLFNMVPYAPDLGEPRGFGVSKCQDHPAWERPDDDPVGVGARLPRGYLDWLTWQSRRVRLLPNEAGRIIRVAIVKGESFPDGFATARLDPFVAYTKGKEAYLPVGFREERVLWRDSAALINGLDFSSGQPDAGQPPVLAALADRDLPSRMTLLAIGLSSDQAKSEFWRLEAFAWPEAFLRPGASGLRRQLVLALDRAESAARLCSGGFVVVNDKLQPAPLRTLAERLRVSTKSTKAYADNLGAERVFWSRLDPPYQALVDAIAAGNPDALVPWQAALRDAVGEAFTVATGGLDGQVRNLEALAVAEATLRRQLHALLPSPRALQEATP